MFPLPRGAAWQLLFLYCVALYMKGVHSDGRVVCYYTNWSVYRPGTAKFNPQNINPYLCTHLIYAFGGFTKDNQMKPFDKYQDIEQGGYAKFTGLKTYNKQLKTMIAIGGWNEASSRFSPLVASPERRQKFIKNILKFLRQNHFDGIDLDWEYPAHREGGKQRDRDNYAQFVQELRAEFERESEKTGRPRLLLTMAVPAGIEYIEKGYDIPKLNKYLDWFNLLTYDFHSSHEPSVNHHAPLYSLEEESEYNYDAELNIDYSVKFYLNAGADRDKLVLGIPTYGRSYTLINEESTEIGAPAEAPGEQGDATREKGYLAYYEICQNIKEDPEWTVVQPNPNAMGPYAYRRNQWVGYDDEAIVRKKSQYVVDNGLGGIMFWAIDNDDFRGVCTGKPYPLIEAAKDAMLDALGLGINEVSKPSAPQKPSRSRSRENSSSTRNRITTNEHKLTYAERKGSSKRTQTTQQATRNKQQNPTTTSAPTTIKLTEAEGSSLYIGGRTTTPPPPTTPDPGTDFKCEEEGFFQHPRDCKKYYWCLDSGPSGLGIVAHQFTCPSGLYFNPAADSCDFARNVPCKTKKSTTTAPITSPATTTTTARPTSSYNRITAATSRPTIFFRTTPRTTTTTTEAAVEEDVEYEEEEDNPPSPFAKPKGFDKDSEEDPKVIKELIELIRKVGGIDELEKHLLRKDDGTISIKESSSSSSSSLTATTPSSISKSLYEKVLSKPNALNSFRNRFTSTSSFRTTKTQTKAQDNTEEDDEQTHENDSKSSGASAGPSKYSSVLRGNSRQGPQSEGIDKISEFDGFFKEKKQYITINRNRGTKQSSADEEEDEAASKSGVESREDDEQELEVDVKSTKKPSSANTPTYSTIRRTRPATTTEATQEVEEEPTERKSYGSLNRSRVQSITTTELPEVTAGSTRYKYLERSRPTRPTTESLSKIIEGKHDAEDDDDDDDDDHETDNQENTVHFKAVNIENTRETQQEFTTNTQRTYASIGRRTTISTTATPETETAASADKTIITTTTTATPTISTTETPITTPLTFIATTTPVSILLTTNTPITTTTNPTTTTSTTKTTTTTLPNGEDIPKSLVTTTNPNEINSDISETNELSQHINSILTDSESNFNSLSNSNPSRTTESGLDTNEKENDGQLRTTEMTLLSSTATTINDNDDKLPKTDDTEQEEVNVVSKQRNKTLYNTRTRTTTTTSPKTTTTNINVDIETTSSPTVTTNAKKTLGVRRQQNLLNRSSQTKIKSTASTSDITTPTTESVNNDFLGTVSSPRPFGFPKRRNRPTNIAGVTTTTATTEEISKPNDDLLITKQKTTKLNAAANSPTKVSSNHTTLSETVTKTSSHQHHIQQNESEVTSTEHLNSKDTKVEITEKHVLVEVDNINGIEIINNHLMHVDSSNNNNNNSNSLHNNNNTTLETVTESSLDNNDDVSVTIKTKALLVTEVTKNVTTDNSINVNEKDSKFNRKDNDISNNTGKYRGKSLENDTSETHTEVEDDYRATTYTTINRRRQQIKQSTETGEDEIAVDGLKTSQVQTWGEEQRDSFLKSKFRNEFTGEEQTTTETASTLAEEIAEKENEKSKKKGETEFSESAKNEFNTEEDVKDPVQDNQKVSSSYSDTEQIDGHTEVIQKPNTDNEDNDSKNSTDESISRTTNISQSTLSYDYDNSTKSENEKKTYKTITRNRVAGSSTENIPYKAIVRDSEGVHLTDGEISGFVKHVANAEATETSTKTYQTISRGGQMLESDIGNQGRDAIEDVKFSPIDTNTDSEIEHTTDVKDAESLTNKYETETTTVKPIGTTTLLIENTTTEAVVTSTTATYIPLTETTSIPETTATTQEPTTKKLFFKNNENANEEKSIEEQIKTKTEELGQTTTETVTQREGQRKAFSKRPTFGKRPILTKATKNSTESIQAAQQIKNSTRAYFPKRTTLTRGPSVVEHTEHGKGQANANTDDLANTTQRKVVSSDAQAKIVGNPSSFKFGNGKRRRPVEEKPNELNEKENGEQKSTENENKLNPETPKSSINNQKSSVFSETVNGRRRIVVKKRIQSKKATVNPEDATKTTADSQYKNKNSLDGKHITGTFKTKDFNHRRLIDGNQSKENTAFNRQITEKKTESVLATADDVTEDDENLLSNNIALKSGLIFKSRNPLQPKTQVDARKSSLYGGRGTVKNHLQNNNATTEEVETLDDGSTRIKTTFIETVNLGGNKVKTIKRTKIKTITKQAPEYIYDDDDEIPSDLATRRPSLRNRGEARFQSNDLSSLLAIDFASKFHRDKQGQRKLIKARRKIIRKPDIIKEEEHVEEIEEELPTNLLQTKNVITTEVPQLLSRRVRPTGRPLMTTTTLTRKASNIAEKNNQELEKEEQLVETTTRRNFKFPSRNLTTTSAYAKTTEKENEATTRRAFTFKRLNTEKNSDNDATSKRVLNIQRPVDTRNTVTTSQDKSNSFKSNAIDTDATTMEPFKATTESILDDVPALAATEEISESFITPNETSQDESNSFKSNDIGGDVTTMEPFKATTESILDDVPALAATEEISESFITPNETSQDESNSFKSNDIGGDVTTMEPFNTTTESTVSTKFETLIKTENSTLNAVEVLAATEIISKNSLIQNEFDHDTTSPSVTKEAVEPFEMTTELVFTTVQPYETATELTKSTTLESTTKSKFSTQDSVAATKKITQTALRQNESIPDKTNFTLTTSAAKELLFSTVEPLETTTKSTESTTFSTANPDALDAPNNKLVEAVQNLKTKTEKVIKSEITDAIETRKKITSAKSRGQELSLPIYHRRKYYKYYKDSPITYISPTADTASISVDTNTKTKIDVAKQIHKVFNVSRNHLRPEPELSDEAIALKAKEQAVEINAELNHFLLKTPGSN